MKIALATDAWHPQISGVVTTFTQTVDHLGRMGQEVLTVHPVKRELAGKGVTHTVLWSRGVDTDLLRMRDKGFIPDPRPVFLYVGRVAVKKNIEAFLTLDLPGTKFLVPVTQTPVTIQGNPSRAYEIPDSI